jgi:hypothetical protein
MEDQDEFRFEDDVMIHADSKKLALGADGTADSYLQWDGAELDIYTDSGVYNFVCENALKTNIQFDFDTVAGNATMKWSASTSYFTFSNGIALTGDNRKLALGVDGATDSYFQWDGAGLDFYSSGGIYDFNAAADTDITLNFIGTTTSGVFAWMEDEDYFKFSDDVMMADGENLVLDTTTGSKIGTATTQKIGFYNATPVDQPATVADADGTLASATSTINTIIDRLQELGLIA